MFKATIDTNRIVVTNPDKEIITSGSVNVNFIQFSFSEDWADLQKTVLFQTKKAQIPIILEGNELVYTMPIPWEVLLYANESINVGAYGTRMDDSETLEDEEIVLPTVWGTIPDKVRQGVIITDPIPTSPTYNAYQLLLKTIADIIASGGGGGGLPGISPTISVEETADGVVLTIVDVNGERSVTITNGVDGRDGQDGNNGADGKDGLNGTDGFSPTVSMADIEGGKRLIITDVNGEHAFDILDGKDGADGSSGVTFTPSVSLEGELSWENDGGLDNPKPVSIKGPKGDPGDTAYAGEVYSTDESVIGTWIDGKTLYRRCYRATAPAVAHGEKIFTLDNADLYITSLYGVLEGKTGNRVFPFGDITASTSIYVYVRNGVDVYMACKGDAYYNAPTTVVIEYTKNANKAISEFGETFFVQDIKDEIKSNGESKEPLVMQTTATTTDGLTE